MGTMSNPENSTQETDPEQVEMMALHEKLKKLYCGYFDENPDADWVMVSSESEEILGGGTDDQCIGEEAFAALEEQLGQAVHLFGKPVEIGLDGATPIFADD